MRDRKTYLSVAPVLTTLWFGSDAGLLIEINRLFPDALSFFFFFFHLGVLNRLIPKRVARPHKTKDKASEAKGPSLVS